MSHAIPPSNEKLAIDLGEPAWNVALLFPPQGNWSEADYLELNTNRMVELTDGCLEVLPTPTKFHQRIVRHLFLQLQQFVSENREGEVFFAPLPVRLWSGKFREPDIVYVGPASREFRGHPEGADLVVEVVSQGEENRRRDLETKPIEYARAGIAEYWIVDPEKREVSVLTIDGDRYRTHGVFGVEAAATSVLLPGSELAVNELFAAGDAA